MTPFLRYVDLKRDTVPEWDRYPFSIPAIRSALDAEVEAEDDERA